MKGAKTGGMKERLWCFNVGRPCVIARAALWLGSHPLVALSIVWTAVAAWVVFGV